MMCNSYNGLTYCQIMASIISWHFFERNWSLSLELIYIIISKNVCLSVWPLIDSAPGHDRMLRLVSLEPASPEPVILEKNFSEKWTVAKLPKINFTPLMLFNEKILLYIFAVHFERALRLVYRYDRNHRTHRKVAFLPKLSKYSLKSQFQYIWLDRNSASI